MYKTANIGTIISDIFAILCTPPNITTAVKTESITPITILSIPKAFLNAKDTVLACTALNTKAKHKVIRTENITPIHLLLRPCSI